MCGIRLKFKRLFDKLFKDGPLPVAYIYLRVFLAAFDLCVACGQSGAALQDLPFAGFIQASSLVGLSCLQPWLDAEWIPVGSKLYSDPQYKAKFLAPDDAALVYFLLLRLFLACSSSSVQEMCYCRNTAADTATSASIGCF